MGNDRALIPNIPVFAGDTPLHICQQLHAVTEHELEYWPRRNVAAFALLMPTGIGPGMVMLQTSMLCLN